MFNMAAMALLIHGSSKDYVLVNRRPQKCYTSSCGLGTEKRYKANSTG